MGLLERDEGGVMILLVCVIAIVLVLSTTVMSTTVMSYKMRLSNITYVSNSYMSDGGLDEATALAILSYEEAITETIEHITEIVEGTFDSIESISSGDQSYVMSPFREYIHPLDHTFLPREVKKAFKKHFSKTFRDCYADLISDFNSQIDDAIDVNITRTSTSTGQCTFSIESTYSEKGIARKNGMDLVIAFPQVSFDDGDGFEIAHPESSVSRNNWRVLYGQ